MKELFHRLWIVFLRALGFYPKRMSVQQISAHLKRGEL